MYSIIGPGTFAYVTNALARCPVFELDSSYFICCCFNYMCCMTSALCMQVILACGSLPQPSPVNNLYATHTVDALYA